VISANPDGGTGIHMWSVPQATEYIPPKLSVISLKSALAILHARVSFYLYAKKILKGGKIIFSNEFPLANEYFTRYLSFQRPATVLTEHMWSGNMADRLLGSCYRSSLPSLLFVYHDSL
jgi:hypothetical protein